MNNNRSSSRGSERASTRGPITLAFEIVFGLVAVSFTAVIVGVLIELGGSYTIWKGQGTQHVRSLVIQDLGYIAAAPKSIVVSDTVNFSHQMIRYIALPFEKFGVLKWYDKAHGKPQKNAEEKLGSGKRMKQSLDTTTHHVMQFISKLLVVVMYVAMDVGLRLSIALYALPAFVLACLVGSVDGLVRRDLRRWSGGRESSFIYHHAKRYTSLALTSGFGLYLAWPFGGFNPALMVLVFTVLVAASLSTTIAAFKKYV